MRKTGIHEAVVREGIEVVFSIALEFYFPELELIVVLQLHNLLLAAALLDDAAVLVVEQELEVEMGGVERLEACLGGFCE